MIFHKKRERYSTYVALVAYRMVTGLDCLEEGMRLIQTVCGTNVDQDLE